MGLLGSLAYGVGMYCKTKATKAMFIPVKGAYKLAKFIDKKNEEKKNKREA